MFREIILPIFRSTRLCVTVCGIMHRRCCRPVAAIFLHDYPLAVEPRSTPMPLVQKKNWRDSLPIDMLLSAVSVLVVAQSSSEIPEGLMNNPVLVSVSLQ